MPSTGDSKLLTLAIPCEPNADVSMAWLGACRSHGTVEMGVHVAKQALVGCARFNINCNSGFLCQTWEDPSCSNPDVENAFGDNDPVDVVEIGKRQAVIGEALNGNAKEKKLQFEIGSVTTKFQMGNLPASLALVTKQQIRYQ
jgi:hypothetical protein